MCGTDVSPQPAHWGRRRCQRMGEVAWGWPFLPEENPTMKTGLLAAAIVVFAGAAPCEEGVLVIDDFETGLKPGWEAKEFLGATEYSVVEDGGSRVLRAISRGAASGLIYRVEFDPKDYPMLTWRWKVQNVLEKGDASRKEGDDYAARVYVVFPHWFPPKTRVLNYIWANKLPQGRQVPNPFMAGGMMIAVQSGQDKTGEWVTQRRDLVADFQGAFGQDPSPVGAIAIMTDTDQTGGLAVAYYDDIRIETR